MPDTADTTHNCGTTGDPLDLLLLDDRQAAVVYQRAGPSGEREDPVIQLAPLLHEEGQGDRQVAALLPHEETLVLVTLDRRVPQVQHAERLAYLLLRADHGEVLHAGAIDLHLHTLSMTVRPDQGHIAAHVLRVPAGIHVRVLQTRLVVPQEVGVRYVGRHPGSFARFLSLVLSPFLPRSLALTAASPTTVEGRPLNVPCARCTNESRRI